MSCVAPPDHLRKLRKEVHVLQDVLANPLRDVVHLKRREQRIECGGGESPGVGTERQSELFEKPHFVSMH